MVPPIIMSNCLLPATVITGACGRIGRAIDGELRENAVDCIGVDMREDSNVCAVDIRDTNRLASVFEGRSLVIHCAGLHAPHVGKVAEDEFRSINVEGTKSVVTAAHMAGVDRLVLTSSTALYGGGSAPGAPTRWIEDDSRVQARTIYHSTKLEAENVVCAAAANGLPASIIRLGRCFPEDKHVMILHRLSRGIGEQDAALAHIKAAQAVSTNPHPVIAVAKTPFTSEDCEELGTRADELIRVRCPTVAAFFESHGLTLPRRIDRIYASSLAQIVWGWNPTKGPETLFR